MALTTFTTLDWAAALVELVGGKAAALPADMPIGAGEVPEPLPDGEVVPDAGVELSPADEEESPVPVGAITIMRVEKGARTITSSNREAKFDSFPWPNRSMPFE